MRGLLGVALLIGLSVYFIAQAFRKDRQVRRSISGEKMLLSEILCRIGQGEQLLINQLEQRQPLSLGIVLENEGPKLIEGPLLPEARRTTYLISWERLVEVLTGHVFCGWAHPLGMRRHEFAEKARTLMLGMPTEEIGWQDRLYLAWALVHNLELDYLSAPSA